MQNLKRLDNLRVLNLCGFKGNFVDIRDISDLRELSLIDCDIEHTNFFGELYTLKELVLTFSNENNSAEFYETINSKVCNLKNLKYYREYITNCDENIEAFQNINSMESLETLVVYDNNNLKNIVESSTIKNLYVMNYDHTLYEDLSDVSFDKMSNLNQIILDGYYPNINYENIVELPNITSVGYSRSLNRSTIPETLTLDLAKKIANSKITSFSPAHLDDEDGYSFMYRDHGPNKDFIMTLYEAGVDDRVGQHYIRDDWRYGREYTLEDFFERWGNGYER